MDDDRKALEARQEEEKLVAAKQQVAAIEGFYIHLFVFVLVMAALFAINLLTDSDWWVQWVLLGWGAGVAAHGLAVFLRGSRLVADWRARKIDEIKARM